MAPRARLIVLLLLATWLSAASGCSLVLPQTAQKPVIRNPFPQLSRVAVAPFFNQSDEPTLDGREVAMAYYAELQGVRGFEVVPVGVVEEAIIAHRIDLRSPGEARRLAAELGVDAVVVGSVTDYTPYYPPRIGLRVEWYAANPAFHEIPAGYGLPFGTPEEEFIPDDLAYEAELAAAKSEMAALTPGLEAVCIPLPKPPRSSDDDDVDQGRELPGIPGEEGSSGRFIDPAMRSARRDSSELEPFAPSTSGEQVAGDVRWVQAQEELPTPAGGRNSSAAQPWTGAGPLAGPPIGTDGATPPPGAIGTNGACFPAAQVGTRQPTCGPHFGPVLAHTRIYRGDDGDVTQALQGYAFFRDDRRIGGWESYLRRSDDFTRFCCHMHISEMLSARGGSRKTQLVSRWPGDR
ncbi:MAG: hypothetical protein KF688_00210 [Pirellulales bacterium]|nr:hypothetical protein [Pirellulales bacterium]MBX3432843.1 hypothetical protein [Pirellulales bacterium]